MDGEIPSNAPKSCPGTTSESAGKATGCDGCPNQKLCASGTGGVVDENVSKKIFNRLKNISNIILILSGKGGVGKSTITTSLAYALSYLQPDRRVAVLDIDITGPSVPTMLGCVGEQIHKSASGWSPIYVTDNLSVISAGFLLSNADQAIVWRGPKKNKLIEQMLSDVNWTDDEDDRSIEYLLIDTPPGTTDEHMSIVQLLRAAELVDRTSALIVTTPQEVALSDVRKEIGFCHKVCLPIAGVVANMCSYKCSACQHEFPVLPCSGSGVAGLCSEFGLELLAELPLDGAVTWCLDNGLSMFQLDQVTDSTRQIGDLWLLSMEQLVGKLEIRKMSVLQ